jgi:PAS domain S-box-containing protein
VIRPRFGGRRARKQAKQGFGVAAETALDAAPVLVRATGPDPADCTWCNRAWLEFRGRPLSEELRGGWVEGLHPDDQPRVLDGYRRAAARKVAYETEYRLQYRDGSYHAVVERGRPQLTADETLEGFIAAAEDITHRRQAEKHLEERGRQRAAIADLGRAALAGREFRELAGDAARLIADGNDVDSVIVHELTPDGELVTVTARGLRRNLDRVKIDTDANSIAQEVVRFAEPIVVQDWSQQRRTTEGEQLRDEGMRSTMCTPIRSPAGPVGTLTAHSREPGRFGSDDVNFLRSVANVLGSALTRQRAEDELRTSETRLRLALDAGRMGTWELDVETGALLWSPELEQLYGFTPGTLDPTVDALLDRVHPDDRQRVERAIRTALEERTQIDLEHRIIKPDGTPQWVEGRGSRVDVGAQSRVVGVSIDIDGRKHADEERERLFELEQQTRRILEETVARLDTLLEHSPYAFAFFDDEFRFKRVNAQFAAIDGIPIEDHLDRTLAEVLPEMWVQLQSSFKEVFATQRAVSDLEVEGRAPGTEWFEHHFLVSCYPVQTVPGEVLGIGAVFVEITDRKRAERSAQLIARTSELFARTDDVERTLNEAIELVLPEFADACQLYLFASREHEMRTAVGHVDPARRETFAEMERRWPLDARPGSELRTALATGRPALLADIDDDMRRAWAQDDEHLQHLQDYGPISAAAAPLQARGEVVGLLVLNYTRDSGRHYRREDLDLVVELARRFAQAIDSALLARAAARYQEQVDLLARAGELITVELDPNARMRRLIEMLVPDFADFCLLRLHDDDVFRLAHWAGELEVLPNGPEPEVDRDTRSVHREVTQTGQPVLRLHPVGGVSSLLSAPLLDADGIPFGTLTAIFGPSGREHDQDDVNLARELARRAAAAFEHAWSFERERATAEVLQRSLLPKRVPVVTGVSTAARYLPGGESERVGGDWYEVFRLPDGTVLLAIGDVVGHGLSAASSTGMLRAGIQLCSLEGLSPEETLDELNRWFFSLPDADMVTMTVALYDPDTRALRFASAGHPPPLRIRANGKAAFLKGALAPPLRSASSVRYRARNTRLLAGDMLVLYTDGLVERRGESVDVGLRRLRDAARSGPDGLEALADHVLARVLPESGPADDVALLLVRAVDRPGPSTRVPQRRGLLAWRSRRRASRTEERLRSGEETERDDPV